MSAATHYAPPRTALYRRRPPERTLLHRTTQTHLAIWFEVVAANDGAVRRLV